MFQAYWRNAFYNIYIYHFISGHWKWKQRKWSLSVWLFVIPSTVPARLLHEIFQARLLDWVVISFSRGSSQPEIEPKSSALQADSLPSEPPGKPGFSWQTENHFNERCYGSVLSFSERSWHTDLKVFGAELFINIKNVYLCVHGCAGSLLLCAGFL